MTSAESPGHGNPGMTARAADLLRDGGVVAFPTETVYGLGADAENDQAVRRIFSIKGRPADHPLIVHLADLGMVERWAREVPDTVACLAEHFWPGPLTIVLLRSSRVSDLVTGGLDTVGIRVPSHPVAQALLREFGGGIAAPSANRFGRISPTSAGHVSDELGSGPALILDGGNCQVGLESTIISLAGGRPVLLRPGTISLSELSVVLGKDITLPAQQDPTMRAPGSHASHYAPRTPAAVVSRANLPTEADRLNANGQRVALLCISNIGHEFTQTAECLIMPEDPAGYGRALYASLRRLDTAGFDTILIEEPPETESWLAVRDRLRRAAHVHPENNK